ncbi:nuclear transport factor 2 family protein [Hirschia litorea]|uniref:Nuclear transport factor 2 family protein n=1 Tax=Hirschia litorea TaxID=1199156 RepID=A0ABW2IHD4_9PROT
MNSPLNAEQLVQAQLDAYNAQDLDAFCGCFSDEVFVTSYLGEAICSGIGAFRERHVGIFGDFPKNRAKLMSRMVLGNTVIDHELVDRGNGDPDFQVGCIYTINNARISRIEYVKAG